MEKRWISSVRVAEFRETRETHDQSRSSVDGRVRVGCESDEHIRDDSDIEGNEPVRSRSL